MKEEKHLLPGSQARPGDVMIRRWSDGKDAALDVTVTSPLASSNLAAAIARPGRTLDMLGQYKISILQMFLYNLI